MKLYFLVEGASSEMQAYPKWLNYLIPELTHYTMDGYEAFKSAEQGFLLVSGYGYPSILQHIAKATEDVVDIADIDYFFIIVDGDELEPEQRKAEVQRVLDGYQLPERVNVEVVIQHRCFETILLANRRAMPRNPTSQPLIDYVQYYDVNEQDPQSMGHFNVQFNHAQFHGEYAIKALRAKRIRYTKSLCGDVATVGYFDQIVSRIDETGHLPQFALLIDTLRQIKAKIS